MAKEPAKELVAPLGGAAYDDGVPMARPALPIGMPAMRMQSKVVTAQKVALPRVESAIKARILELADVNGDKYFYSIPYSGKGGGAMVMGPSVKLASDAARIYGNCEVNCEYVQETDEHFVFEGVFIDYETGYVLRRPFLQRKNQDVGIKDSSRALDQVFQIAASKATRNVICRAIPEIVDAGYERAKMALVNRVQKDPQKFKDAILAFLGQEEVNVELGRVEKCYGKTFDKFTVQDLAKLASQCSTVRDNMADADDIWPPLVGEPKKVAETKPKAETKAEPEPEKKAEPAKAKPKAEPKKAEPAKAKEPEPEPEPQQTAEPEPEPEPAQEEAPAEEEKTDKDILFD